VKLESLKKTIQDVAQDYKSFRERNNGQWNSRDQQSDAFRDSQWWHETKISFNEFHSEIHKIKKRVIEAEKITALDYSEIHQLMGMVNITDQTTFAYYYEMYKLYTEFIFVYN
jgi:hypothetical protein